MPFQLKRKFSEFVNDSNVNFNLVDNVGAGFSYAQLSKHSKILIDNAVERYIASEGLIEKEIQKDIEQDYRAAMEQQLYFKIQQRKREQEYLESLKRQLTNTAIVISREDLQTLLKMIE